MASELIVQTLKGPTTGANANKVIIPSGQTLDASAGSISLPATTLEFPMAIFSRYSRAVYSSGTFHTRAFETEEYNDITGASIDGSGYVNLPAGKYHIEAIVSVGASTTYGNTNETRSRIYDHAGSVVIESSYSNTGMSQLGGSADGSNTHCISVILDTSSLVALTVQSYCEDNSWHDYNVPEGLGSIAADQRNKPIIMTVTQLRVGAAS
jgi:hypothetical protein